MLVLDEIHKYYTIWKSPPHDHTLVVYSTPTCSENGWLHHFQISNKVACVFLMNIFDYNKSYKLHVICTWFLFQVLSCCSLISFYFIFHNILWRISARAGKAGLGSLSVNAIIVTFCHQVASSPFNMTPPVIMIKSLGWWEVTIISLQQQLKRQNT